MPDPRAADAPRRRLGRAVLFILQQDPVVQDNVVRADIDTLLLAGRAMDFASRLQGYGATATPEIAKTYARLAGLSYRDVCQRILPILKQADVVDYKLTADGTVSYIEEFVGITAPVIEQTFRVLDALGPSEAELGVLHSVEIAAWAPLTAAQHLEQVARRGLPDQAAQEGLRLALAAGINRRVRSAALNENVIFNPYVWGTRQVEVATWLRGLPPAERDVLFAIFEQASTRPGIALNQMTANSAMVTGARKIGLVQAATVKSTTGQSRTYVFSPLMQASDDAATTTEALHLRKLFVAHILFGHEHADPWHGRIDNPTILVRALLNRGQVGPATSIATDYALLEAQGVVQVEEIEGTDRAILRLLKREIVEAGLDWLNAGLGSMTGRGSESTRLHQTPGTFVKPEIDRARLPDEGAATEITHSAVLALREEIQRVARADSPFPPRA